MRNQKGFTLIELIAVVIILGIITLAIVPRMMNFEGNAFQQVIDAAIQELNTREKLVWSNGKLLGIPTLEDLNVYIEANIDRDLGNGTDISCDNENCTISVRGRSAEAIRSPAKSSSPAIWSRR